MNYSISIFNSKMSRLESKILHFEFLIEYLVCCREISEKLTIFNINNILFKENEFKYVYVLFICFRKSWRLDSEE